MAKEKTTKKDKKKENDTPVEETVEQVVEETTEENKDNSNDLGETESKEEVEKDDSQEETVEEKVTEPEIVEEVDEIEELIKPQTEEENKLVKLLKEYKFLSDLPEDKVKASDLELKVKKLCEIIYFPQLVNVKNPSYLYSDIEKFFTKYRRTILKESFATKYSYAIGNKVRFNNCMVVYTILIALVDCKVDKKPFTMNIETAAKILGSNFETFIAWISNRIEKFK